MIFEAMLCANIVSLCPLFRREKQVTLTLKKSSLEKDLQQKILITTAFVTRAQFFCILITVIFNTQTTYLRNSNVLRILTFKKIEL